MEQIHPHSLWVGHAGDGRDFRRLFAAGIEAVVQLAAEEPPLHPPRDLVVCRFPLADGPGNRPEMLSLAVQTVAHLLALRVPTLVCCGAGASRSPAVAAAALAVAYGKPPDDMLRLVAGQHRTDVSPGFWGEVKEQLLAPA